jgi:penicillin-insensitive murein DD-endopeptidase
VKVFARAAALTLLLAPVACARAPSPLLPHLEGSIGTPNRGVLTASLELPREGKGYRWLRQDDRHHGLPRFVRAIERAAARVEDERPGGMLAIGDLSARGGGALMPHLSHRSGRDVDLLLYLTTLDGAPVESPGFLHVGTDGLAWDAENKRFLRLDIERTWLLVKSLLEDPDARVQWLFTHRNLEALLVQHARARGDDSETILRALETMQQPSPGGPHDDHVHVRTACAPDEIAQGCEPTGPERRWTPAQILARGTSLADKDLALAILRPFGDAGP